MKRLIFIFIALIYAVISPAQEVVGKYDSRTGSFGFYNERAQKWVISPKYKNIKLIGAYEGIYYWRVQSETNSLYGIISSDDFSHFRVNPQFNLIYNHGTFAQIPVVRVQKKADWGLLEIGTKTCYYLRACQYKNIYDNGNCEKWNGSFDKYDEAAIKNMYENAVREERNKEQRVRDKAIAIERARKDSIVRAEKEKRMASFTLYAKEYVTPKVNEWQQKDEFETTAEYQERVTGTNREQKIRELTKEAEDKFIKENAALNPIDDLSIEPYDADNQVFSIISPKFGQLLIPIPRTEARAFKEHFENNDVFAENPVYFIEEDKIALRSLAFNDILQDKIYHYNNRAALNYQQYEINVDALDLAPVRITSSTSTAPPVTSTIKPTCDILFPHKGSTYSTPTIRLRYLANVDPSTTATVRFLVAGQEVVPIQSNIDGETAKGVRIVNGSEVELPMPQEVGRETPVAIQVVDGYGTWAEMKSITLKYVGEKPKPTLHLLSVGVSDYDADDLQTLNYAAKDAQDFVRTIASSDLSMYKEMKPTLLVNSEATTRKIQRELSHLVSRVAQGDVVMLFFSGHGIVHNKERYFMTADASAEDYYNGLEFDFIRKRMTEMSADKQCRVLIFMDACHSGAMTGTKGSIQDITFATPGVIGFYSSTAGEQSAELDKLQNGVFTRVLLDGLKGGAKDAEGQVTLHTLDTYVKENVKAKTKGKQTPIVENATGDAVLFHVK